ncbi:MAG: DUF4198 domain-containing protein [Xanthomonadales bacterium]|nr:hypothetical protein [Xanthomonadales bacterium]MCC6592776.1 DUF4198 domain-containing protein [Xanthomonadales bacterium]MCE7932518.1 DUF4198 domain-containing protein [Xanthomonadales bacterium PRO6]
MKICLESLALAALLALAPAAQAHKAWLLPSATVLSGDQPWVTVDAAVSNDLFYFNHVPLRTENLHITAPDGSAATPQNLHTGKYRSVFDLQLQQGGTYRIAVTSAGLMARWEERGEPRGWRGSAENFVREVPQDAEKLQVTQASNRIETFVTNGAPSEGALKPTGVGLELIAATHPNDLYAGETAKFRMTMDGKPAAGVRVEAIAGGTRYRDALQEIVATTDEQGNFSLSWPASGMYWLQAVVQDDQASPPATSRRAAYVATLEVLPQ